MTAEEFKNYIRYSQENDSFCYSKNVLIKILGNIGSWENDWFQIYKRILARIKKGHGSQDGANNDGKVVCLPAGKENFMAVFFSLLPEKGFFIYDFKTGKRK